VVQASKHRAGADRAGDRADDRLRRLEAPGPVRSLPVVEASVLGQDSPEVLLVDDDDHLPLRPASADTTGLPVLGPDRVL
jgi:hypothetical protein